MKCYLKCSNNSHDPIPLPDGEAVFIGRTADTKIADPRCSRKQVELHANYQQREVIVKQLGSNHSAIDKTDLVTNSTLKLKEGSVLYVLSGQYPHCVTFTLGSDDPSMSQPDSTSKSTVSRKRKSSQTEINSSEHKISRKSSENCEEKGDDVDVIKRKLENMKKSKQSTEKSDSGTGTSGTNSLTKTTSENPAKKLKTSESKAINNNSTDISSSPESKCAETNTWVEKDKLCVFVGKGVRASNKIAAFDIDGTIICTKSGNVFPKHPDDWQLWHSSVATKIQKLHNSGYKIVFITNQLGVSRGKTSLPELKKKFEKIVEQVHAPVQGELYTATVVEFMQKRLTTQILNLTTELKILISTANGLYRKPAKGMWSFLMDQGNDGFAVNLAECFYVGDAAGRKDKWAPGKKKDFSMSDRLFALNIGLKFYTPDEYFLKCAVASYSMPDFDPRNNLTGLSLLDPPDSVLTSHKTELIITVGSPASGKSTFVRETFIPKGYVHVSRDNLKSWQKCVAACVKALQGNKSVVVDNTNPDVDSRHRYVEVSKQFGVPCRCFLMATSHTQSRHNERFRQITDTSHQPINDMIVNSYKSKYVEPKLKEGFSEIIRVNFVPKFANAESKQLYQQFLLEK